MAGHRVARRVTIPVLGEAGLHGRKVWRTLQQAKLAGVEPVTVYIYIWIMCI